MNENVEDLIKKLKSLESDIEYNIIEMCGNKSIKIMVEQYFKLVNELISRLDT